MKKCKLIMAIAFGAFAFFSCEDLDISLEEIVITANRADGTVSFINANTDTEEDRLLIPGSEPMYAVYVESVDRIYVGDRAQDEVHVIDPDTRTVESSISVGNGVFHMWADLHGNQLWVNNDIENTTSVIDIASNAVIATVPIGSKPHDVFVTASRAYVSVFSETDAPDSVFAYSTYTCEKLGAVAVGKDPHLFYVPYNGRLFVPCQSGQIFVLNGSDLSVLEEVALEGVHGIFHAPDNEAVYVTNISGAELYAVDDFDAGLIGSPVPTAFPIPHNITVNFDGTKMFVSHSGASADKVTSYTLGTDGSITAEADLTVGRNPFGIAYYARFIFE